MDFEFGTASRLIFGAGVLARAGEIAAALGKRALVVTGRNQKRAEPLVNDLRTRGLAALTFSVFGEPETETIEQGVKLARQHRAELIIGIGGGSAIDSGKAIAALLTNAGELLDYLEVIGGGKPLANPSAPFIAIPTTAGTGSEVTRNAVLSSSRHKVKVSLRSPFMLPRVALIDPALTRELPPAITAYTGLDALTQLIEPFVCNRANPMTDALCLEGMERAAHSLRRAFQNGSDAPAREDMCVASLFGGVALANAGLGAVHGFAGPIGGMFPAPHGAICAALLPHVIESNLQAARRDGSAGETVARYDRIARVLTSNSAATADEAAAWTRSLVSDLRIPPLRTYGIRKTHLPEIAEKAAKASSMKANPIELSRDELIAALERAL
jgi:alcohol dehydrogenase class IV